jgi:hypothetical protein
LVLVCLLSLLYYIYLCYLQVLHLSIHFSFIENHYYVNDLYLIHALKYFIFFLIFLQSSYLHYCYFITCYQYAIRLFINDVHHVHHDHHDILNVHCVLHVQYVFILLKFIIISLINSIILLLL